MYTLSTHKHTLSCGRYKVRTVGVCYLDSPLSPSLNIFWQNKEWMKMPFVANRCFFPGKSLGEWKFLYTRLFGGETSVLVAHKTHPLKAICKGARWKMMVLKVTFFHCFGFFIHLCWWSRTINYMPSGQLISCLIEPQSSSQGCYMALWRCSSSSIELLFFVPHTSIACV